MCYGYPLPTILRKAKSKVPCGFRVTSNDGDRGGSWPNKAGRTEKSTCSKATAMDASLNPQIWWSHAELCGMSILFQPSKVLYSRSRNIPDGILLNRIFWWTMQVWESWGSAQKYTVYSVLYSAAEVNLGACSLHPISTSRWNVQHFH